ncbi:MAG: tol-pal system-associated acyl-CoA thioesterase [Gammaproteobacteria bacterium]|jgi:acyl-CoA thioester hydrolase|nr:tol-pal system-associated acyl-CoA thioesterase [Gammaproteobacteria bacterium]
MSEYNFPVRVYYEDTDAGGIVYYANYLKFMERARTEWLRSMGVDQPTLMREQRLMFVVVSTDVKYLKPARFDDLLNVSCRVVSITRTSLSFVQEIRREDGEGELLVSGTVKAACVDADRLRPRAIPAKMLEEFV